MNMGGDCGEDAEMLIMVGWLILSVGGGGLLGCESTSIKKDFGIRIARVEACLCCTGNVLFEEDSEYVAQRRRDCCQWRGEFMERIIEPGTS